MIKRALKLLCLLLLLGVTMHSPQKVSAVEKQQTIPTRTPTPAASSTPIGGGGDPTQPPPPTSEPPGDDTPAPPPAGTAVPTATPTLAVTLAATPEGGYLPTAAPCSPLPTVQALGRVNVRSGPGPGYTLLNQLSYLEVRLITGRVQFANWWQIELVNGTLGWVGNDFVVVSGYTGQVPIVPAPSLPDGSTPVPGPAWNPTPNPICTPMPTTSPTNTPPPTPTDTEPNATTPGNVNTDDGRGDTGAVPLSTEPEPAGQSATIEAIADDITSESPPPAIPVAPTAVAEQAQTVVAGDGETNTDGLDSGSSSEVTEPEPGFPLGWLPIAGLGLIVAGAVIFFLRRQ